MPLSSPYRALRVALPLCLATTAAAANASALAAPPRPQHSSLKSVKKTAPKKAPQPASSPGLIVCYPVVTASATSDQADFGAGCGFYLELNAAGRPELGQTPMISSAYRVAQEMKQPTLRLRTATEAASLAAKTGATHVALGEISGDATSGTLTYRLYRADPNGSAAVPVGDPLVARGSRAQILATLPKMAATLRTRLVPSLATAPLPPTTKATPDEMVHLGSAAAGFPAMTAAQKAALTSLWQRIPEAAVLYLSDDDLQNGERQAVTRQILSAFPDSPLVYAHVGSVYPGLLVPFASSLHAQAQRFPRSYALAHSEVWLFRAEGRPDGELVAAVRTAQDALSNPDALLTYGWSLSTAAQTVRQGKTVDRISPGEAAYLDQVYPRWFAAVRRAAEIDPNYGKAWVRVAVAGTFAGQQEEATAAYDRARTLLGPDRTLLAWGLQMFHPKWGGDPAKLREVAEDIAKANWSDPEDAMAMATEIERAGLPDIGQRMTEDLLSRSETTLLNNPKDRAPHYALAVALHHARLNTQAQKEFEQVARLYPEDARMQYAVGQFLMEKGQIEAAEAAFAIVLRLNPQHITALIGRGYILKEMNRLPEAEQLLQQAVAIGPDYGEAWSKLGLVYTAEKKYDPGIAAFKKAMAFQVMLPEVYISLSDLYGMKKDWQASLDIAKQGENLFPQNPGMPAAVGKALLGTQEWDKSIAASRRALAMKEDFGLAHVNLGKALIGKGNIAEGRRELERGIQIGGAPEMIEEAQAALAQHPG